jgi:hypothetical protein
VSILHSIFNGEYDIEFEVRGNGTVSNEAFDLDVNRAFERYKEECGGEPRDLSLVIEDTLKSGFDYGFTEVETAFLERLENLKELILPDSITEIKMTDKLERILKENNTLIRGSLDSFAERFAAEMGLNFRPADFIFARHVFAKVQEITLLTVQFNRDGSVQIRSDVDSPGSSAGNTFGGVFYNEIPSDFWLNTTVEEVSAMYPGLDDVVVKDGRLADFIEKAKEHKIYTGKN